MGLRSSLTHLYRSRRSRLRLRRRPQAEAELAGVRDDPTTHSHLDENVAPVLPRKITRLSSQTERSSASVARLSQTENLHSLSTIERLPTELLQHIASYLVRRYPTFEGDLMLPEFTSCPGFFGLIEFRETSRTIRAKTDFTFNAYFETHALSFTDGSILSLLEMSYHEGIRSRMSSVTFVAPYPNWNRYSYYGHPRYERRLKLAAELPEVRDLLRCHPINTSIIAAALRRLGVTSVVLGPSLVTTHWDDSQQSECDKVVNPAAIIFNATILSRIRLECLYMDMADWGTFQGMQPDLTCFYLIKARPLSYLENMTTLALALHNPMSTLLTSVCSQSTSLC